MEISKELNHKVREYLQDNPVTIYWDYRDSLSLEQVEDIMNGKLWEIESDIRERNIDYICGLEDNLLEELKGNFVELSDMDVFDLREEFIDSVHVDININELLRNTPDVRIRVVIHSNYEGVNYADRGNGDFKDSEYIKEIKKLLRGKYDKKSFQDELDNICSSCNQLIFYFKSSVEDLIDINKNFKNKVTIPKEALCGFFDSWNGSGSLLEIKLLKDVTLKKQWGETKYDSVDIVLDEKNSYSVEATYGLCNVPEVEIKVK